jgi:hypothetical protein
MKTHGSVCLCLYPLIIARQRIGKHVPAAKNTHVTIENLSLVSLYVVCILTKESRRLVLPRTYCSLFFLSFSRYCSSYLQILYNTNVESRLF